MEAMTLNFQQLAEVQLQYKPNTKAVDRPQINSSKNAYEVLMRCFNEDTLEIYETFVMLLLNRANRVMGFYEVSKGGVSGTIVDPKIIFSVALKSVASGIVICHNHPSGNLSPSQADKNITKQLKAAGKLLDIAVLDHIIVTSDSYYSFADEGVL